MSLQLDRSKTALVLIDLQKGILAQSLAPYPAADVLRNAVTLGSAFAEAGSLIVPVNVAFSSGSADRLMQPVDTPAAIPAGGPPPEWSDLSPEIAAFAAPFRITKRQWSAFHGTELDLQLRRRGITTIVLGGVSTNFGVESTARDAWQHNYSVIIAEDACTSSVAELHRFAIEKILPRVSRVRSTADVVEALRRT